MKRLKHILMGIALLAALLPCVHALEPHDHGHNAAAEQCALDGSPCECHACDHKPCAADKKIQFHRAPDSTPIERPPLAALLFILPQTQPALKKAPPLVSGTLASLQTIQLLI